MTTESHLTAPPVSECAFEGNRWSGDGVKLAYALRNGEVVHVSTVPNGAACGCICPACKSPLIARHGEEKQDHFAHPPGTNCRTGPQTIVHLLGKQILEQHPVLLLPALVASGDEQSVVIAEEAEVTLINVRIEERLDGVIPDVMATVGGRDLLIEIYYTHKCGREKKKRLAEMDLDTVEIDLSRLVRNAAIPDVAAALHSLAPREWIYNSRIAAAESRLKQQAERRRQIQERADQERRRAQAGRVAKLVAATTEAKVAADRRQPPPPVLAGILENVRNSRFGNLVGPAVEGDFAFTVAPAVWQALLIDRFVMGPLRERRSSTFTLKDAFDYPRLYHLIAGGLSGFISDADEAAVRREIPDFVSPFNVLMAYVDFLEGKRILEKAGRGHRRISHDVWSDEEQRQLSEQLFKERAAAVLDRCDAIINELDPADRNGFDPRRWFDTAGENLGPSPRQLCERGIAHGELLRKLAALQAMLVPGGEPVDDLMGLPLDRILTIRRREAEERARAKRERDEELALLAAQLHERTIRAVAAQLGLSDRWLETPCEALGGSSPVESARTGNYHAAFCEAYSAVGRPFRD